MPGSYQYVRQSSARGRQSKSPRPGSSSTNDARDDVTLDAFEQASIERRLRQLEPPVVFHERPDYDPLCVCFDYPGTRLTHQQVYEAVVTSLVNIPHASVVSLRFAARNVALTTLWVDNRWIIKLSTKQCVNVMLGRGITLNMQNVKVRRYDDVLQDEYEKYVKYVESVKKKRPKSGENNADVIDTPKTSIFSVPDMVKRDVSNDDVNDDAETLTLHQAWETLAQIGQ